MARGLRGMLSLSVATLLAACSGAPASVPPTAAPKPALTATATAAATAPPTAAPELLVVAVGDSIAYNSPNDCPGCTGFVDSYARELAKASGKTVGVDNMSQHNDLTVDRLLSGLQQDPTRIDAVARADVVIVGIAHNDVPMNRDDDSCDGPSSERPDWSKFTDACLATELARFRPMYEAVYARVAALRAGKPTLLRTINRYNDWNGWPGHDLSSAGLAATVKVIAAWNEMICAAATKSGFVCADISTAFNGPDGMRPSGDLLGGDYTHPSQNGNDVIARVLLDLGFAPLVPSGSSAS